MRALAGLVLLSGCTAVFGLEGPVHRDQLDDAAPLDDARIEDDAPIDSTPIDAAIDAAPDAALVCPGTFTAVGSSHYLYGNQNMTWTNAETICAAYGAGIHLAVISSETERAAVQPLSSGAFWIGLTDRVTEGTFVWLTDEDTAGYPGTMRPPWAPNYPMASTNTNCVVQSNGVWGDISCTTAQEYLCECDGYAVNPASY